jgi:hypothetical protein
MHPVISLRFMRYTHLFVFMNKTNAFNKTIIHFNLDEVASNLIFLPCRMQIMF